MHLPLFLILGALLLAACGQSEPQAKGETGPPGPAGPPGSSAGGPAIRFTTGHCDRTVCGASCAENEQILNAYALNPGGVIAFVDQRNVTFQPKEQSTTLVLACIETAKQSSQSPAAPQEVSPEERACITAAAAKLPNIAALQVERSRALPQRSAQGRDRTLSNVKVEIDVSVAGQSSTYVFNCVRQGQLVVVQPMGMR
jgi:hypothetical protein